MASSCPGKLQKGLTSPRLVSCSPEFLDILAVGHVIRDGQVQKAHEIKALCISETRTGPEKGCNSFEG